MGCWVCFEGRLKGFLQDWMVSIKSELSLPERRKLQEEQA